MRTVLFLIMIFLFSSTSFAYITEMEVEDYGSALKLTYTETESKVVHVKYLRKTDIVEVNLSGTDMNSPYIQIIRRGDQPEKQLGTIFRIQRDHWDEAQKIVKKIVEIVFKSPETGTDNNIKT